jgi:4-hydroxy-2-oxoglutarate aldolase
VTGRPTALHTHRNRKLIQLAGVYPPIPTPFTTEEALAFSRLESNMERWNREPIAGYVVGGSNGEFVHLSLEERVEVVRTVLQTRAAGRLVIAGAGMESAHETIVLAQEMASAGADLAIVVTPSYYKSKMTSAAFEDFYTRVADASPIPVLIYNVPSNTGVDIAAEAVIRLSEHPNIIGMKDSSGNLAKMAFVIREAAEGFHVLTGSAGFFLPALSVGAVGVVPALGNFAASLLKELMDRYAAGDIDGARALQWRAVEANTAVTTRFGVPGLKAALDMLGYYGGPVRSPLLPLTQDEKSTLEDILRRAGLLA